MVVTQAGEAGSYFVIDTYWVWGPGPSLGHVRWGCSWPLCSRCHFVSADGRRQCWAGQATAEVASSFLHNRQAAVCHCPLCESEWSYESSWECMPTYILAAWYSFYMRGMGCLICPYSDVPTVLITGWRNFNLVVTTTTTCPCLRSTQCASSSKWRVDCWVENHESDRSVAWW